MANRTSSLDSSYGDDERPLADAQGQAALLLIESLIHSLLDNGALTKAQALEAIGSAMEVKEESIGAHKEPEATLRRSLALLVNMQLSIDSHSGLYDKDPGGVPRPGR